MKRFFDLFVLTRPEQRLVIALVVLLAAGAWFKHHRDSNTSTAPQPTPTATPSASRSGDLQSPTN